MFVNLVMEMEAQIAQWYAILFCASTTHGELQQAFGDYAISKAQAFCWHKMFSEGRTLIEDEQHSRSPSTKWRGDNTAQVRELFRSDRRLTVKMTSD
jgi:hypothetical protein